MRRPAIREDSTPYSSARRALVSSPAPMFCATKADMDCI